MMNVKNHFIRILRWSERYTKTDMVYLAQSSFWLQASSLFVSFSSFFLYVIFAHVLPKEVYGTYQYLLSMGAIVSAFTLSGMSTAVTRAVARGYEGTFRESIRIQLLWSVVPLLGSWTIGGYYLFHGNTTLGWGLMLIGVFVPINTTFNTYAAYLNGKGDFRRAFFYSLFVNIPYYLAVALVAFSLPVALALLVANLVSQALGYYIAHRKTVIAYRPNEKHDPEAITQGKHYSLINFLTAVITQADNLLVFHFLGAAPLALYSFATAIPDRLDIFKNITSAAFPKFSIRTHTEIRSSIGHKILISIGVALAIAMGWCIIAYPFFALFFPKYVAAVPYSQAYVFTIAATFGSLFMTSFTAHGNVKVLYVYKTLAPLLQLSLMVVGILSWGLWGLIVARIVGFFLSSLFAMYLFFQSTTLDRSKIA